MFFKAARHRAFEAGSEEIHVHQKVLMIALIWAINVFEKMIFGMQ
jgi:hypothetical protein